MTEFLLDTNTLSEQVKFLTGNRGITSKVDLYGPHRCAISAITLHELMYGQLHGKGRISKDKLARMGATYPRFAMLPFEEAAARAGAEVRDILERRGLAIGAFDCMIAGHAIASGRVMITANVKEFSRVAGLTVQNRQT